MLLIAVELGEASAGDGFGITAEAELRGSGPCGDPEDYRVPDQAYFQDTSPAMFHPTAAMVVEIVSPGDESHEKLGFYSRLGVGEVLVVDPDARTIEWFVRGGGGFVPSLRSSLLEVSSDELAGSIDWPG